MSHDLESACETAALAHYGVVLKGEERQELRKANRYYAGKGFEYFLFKHPDAPFDRSGPQQALAGWPDLPNEKLLEVLVERLLQVQM